MLRPHAIRAHEDIRRAGVGLAWLVVVGRPHKGDVASQRHRPAEVGIGSGVRGRQLRLLDPGVAGVDKDVRRAGVGLAVMVVIQRADDRRVIIQRYRTAEVGAGGGVRGNELDLLRPGAARADEHVRGAGVDPTGVVVLASPDQQPVTVHSDGAAKAIRRCAIRGTDRIGRQRPVPRGACAHNRRARIHRHRRPTGRIGVVSPYYGRVAVYRHGNTVVRVVGGEGVEQSELNLLRPHGT